MDCLFCKIIKGEIPAYKVYEDKEFLAFLDIRPFTKGHCLVIPRIHVRWVNDVKNFGAYFEVAKKISLAAQKAFSADWLCFLTLGLEIEHAHIHVIPRYNNDLHGVVVDLKLREQFLKEEMEKIAQKISNEIEKA